MTDSRFNTVICSDGDNLDAALSAVFGRCAFFIFVDPQTGDFQAESNGARDLDHGAGRKAAQLILDRGTKNLVAAQVGPKAKDLLEIGGIRFFHHSSPGSLREILDELAEDLKT